MLTAIIQEVVMRLATLSRRSANFTNLRHALALLNFIDTFTEET